MKLGLALALALALVDEPEPEGELELAPVSVLEPEPGPLEPLGEAPELEAPAAELEAAVDSADDEPEVLVARVVAALEVPSVVVEGESVEEAASEEELVAASLVVLRELTALEPVNLMLSEEPDLSDQV